MATKAKTKASRAADRKSNRSQAANRKRATQAAPALNALELLEQDHRQVEELFDQYDQLKADDQRKGDLAQKICLALGPRTD